jgi:hypoxanthine phosphoribosyltransferase
MRFIPVQNEIEVLYTAEQIAERVHELGRMITSDYADKDLVCVGTVEDSFIFMADLVRAIQRPVECFFIKAITDQGVEEENRCKKIFYTSVTDLANRHVLMVVGMLDTGVTVDFLSRNILLQRPSSLKIIALIDKPEVRRSPAAAEYAAFTVRDRYVVGYGLGVGGRYKNFPSLAVLKGKPSVATDGVMALSGQTDG